MNIIQRYQNSLAWADEINRFFDRDCCNSPAPAGPRESVLESGDAWILRVDLPGFTREDLKLAVTDRSLDLTAEAPEDRAFTGKVERKWKLGPDIDAGAIAANLENGVLELKLPKRPKEEIAPKSITIN